jgi:uncharacterized protein (DUF1778 family)
MTEKKQVHLKISSSAELNAAIKSAADERGQTVGEFARAALARAAGVPQLAKKIKMGRPRLDG